MRDGPARILVVEDDVDLAAGICENLEAEGYSVTVATDGEAGLSAALKAESELLVLDVILPGVDGFEICHAVRRSGLQVPVLFLTARSEPGDRIRGLEEGGDDYMTKPFQLRELLLRVAAILRRSHWYSRSVATVIEFGDNRVDLRRYRATGHDGREHELSHKEAMILKLLADREGEVVTRDEILDVVWGVGAYPTNRTIDNFVLRLRQRFERVAGRPRHFHTVHGAGYRFTRDS